MGFCLFNKKIELTLKLKDPKRSYNPGDSIQLLVNFETQKVYKDAEIGITFKGTKGQNKLFNIKKTLSVNRWNNKESLYEMHEIEFDIASPTDVILPTDYEGVYAIEASFNELGRFGRYSVVSQNVFVSLIPKKDEQ